MRIRIWRRTLGRITGFRWKGEHLMDSTKGYANAMHWFQPTGWPTTCTDPDVGCWRWMSTPRLRTWPHRRRGRTNWTTQLGDRSGATFRASRVAQLMDEIGVGNQTRLIIYATTTTVRRFAYWVARCTVIPPA